MTSGGAPSGTVWVYCRACRRSGLVNRKLGVKGAIDTCSDCRKDAAVETKTTTKGPK